MQQKRNILVTKHNILDRNSIFLAHKVVLSQQHIQHNFKKCAHFSRKQKICSNFDDSGELVRRDRGLYLRITLAPLIDGDDKPPPLPAEPAKPDTGGENTGQGSEPDLGPKDRSQPISKVPFPALTDREPVIYETAPC